MTPKTSGINNKVDNHLKVTLDKATIEVFPRFVTGKCLPCNRCDGSQ